MEILIAEDDLVTRSLLKKTLLACEHSVLAVADGLQAWECLQKKTIPLVITDWAKPHMDGLDLCRKIPNPSLWLKLKPAWCWQKICVYATACCCLPKEPTSKTYRSGPSAISAGEACSTLRSWFIRHKLLN